MSIDTDLDLDLDLVTLLAELELHHHPRARHVRLRVVPPGRVRVSAPRGFEREQLPNILQRHEPWLRQQLQLVRGRHQAAQQLPGLVNLPACGEQWSLRAAEGAARAVVRERAGWLQLEYGAGLEWRAPLQRWLNRKARQVLQPRLDAMAARTGLKYARLSIRAQRGRWGSCSVNGAISLNRNLLFLPPEQVEYLLLHELCHTRELNHSARYWALVERHMPDYRVHDHALRGAMSRLPAWALPGQTGD